MALSAEQKLSVGRLIAVTRAPYFGKVLMAFVPRKTTAIETLSTSEHGLMFWNEKFVNSVSQDEMAGLLVHEASHVLRNHLQRTRASGADPMKMNIAQDAEVNDDIIAMGFKLPADGIFPHHFGMSDGRTAEEYYARYPQQPPHKEHGCGGCCGNPAKGEPSDEGDVAGRSDVELDIIRKQVAHDISKHVPSRYAGNVPAGWKDWANVTIEVPRVPWQKKLARACRGAVAMRAGAVDYTHSRMSRRQAAVGYGPGKPVMSALVAPTPNVLVAIDTSGSMYGRPLSQAIAECTAIFKATGTSVGFIACDCAVHVNARLQSPKDILRNLKGGGGTHFAPIFTAIEQRRDKPALVVVITDGEGSAPAQGPRGTTVLWVIVNRYERAMPHFAGGKPFGTFIHVDIT